MTKVLKLCGVSLIKVKTNKLVSSKSLCKLAYIVLKHNYFELGKDLYRQVLGTAIEIKFVPHHANIFMVGLEEDIFGKSHLQP